MRFWQLITHIWPFGKSDRAHAIRRLPSQQTLVVPDECEDRTARSAIYYVAPEPEVVQTAEVIHVSAPQQASQYSGTQSRFRQLSVVVVDYLLEHEWFYLLTGQRITQPGPHSLELEPTHFVGERPV